MDRIFGGKLIALAERGSGDGDGYGDGSGDGYGYGYGDGDGSGDGYGYGDGYGSKEDFVRAGCEVVGQLEEKRRVG